jgi:protein SCO1/2
MKATMVNARLKAAAFILVWLGVAVNLGGSLAWAAPSGSTWGANYFPNAELIDQDGQKVRFYDDLIKGKVFAVNFIYTQCKAVCPLETAAMLKIYNQLGDHMGRDVFFYTISIDTERDDPAALKAYARRYKTGPGWLFLTGSATDVKLIQQKLGMYRADRSQAVDLSGHSTNILMGAEKLGQWIKRSPFEEPQALARILKTRLLRKHDRPGVTTVAQAEAVDPLHDTPGAKLFRENCSACHTKGSEAGIGPGLAGVTRQRDKAWLKRWIKEPDKMLAAKDAQATALFKQYNEVYMPNFQLSDQQVDDVIAYLQATATPAGATP